MPTDASAGDTGNDDLTFATHHLGRDRVQPPGGDELGFAPAGRPSEEPAAEEVIVFVPGGTAAAAPPEPPAPPTPHAPPPPPAPVSGAIPQQARALAPAHSFVIRETQVAPVSAVDALVVGAPATGPRPFQIGSFTAPAASAAADELPWTVRDPAPGSASPAAPSRRGWSSRRSGVPDSTAAAAMLRLREEAVHVSWKAAWIAVTTADPRLSRRRRR